MSEYSIVGKRVPRSDAPAKALGAAQFFDDLALPKTLTGKFLRSPYAHARILNIDVSKAKKVSGVKAVITAHDTLKQKYGLFPQTRDQYMLALDKVNYMGEEVAAVAALDEDSADEALRLIKVEYKALPAVLDPLEAIKEGAFQIHERAPGNIAWKTEMHFGDVEKGFLLSDYVYQESFRSSTISHCPMEPYGAVASWEPTGKLHVWMPNMSPFTRRRALSNLLGIPLQNIRVHHITIGGAFGGRSDVFPAEFAASLLSMKTGRPVKIAFSREESHENMRMGHGAIFTLKVGIKKDGTFIAEELRTILDGGAYLSSGIMACASAATLAEGIYRFQHYSYEGLRLYTNKTPCSMHRNHPTNMLTGLELIIDKLAGDIGMDPLELRLKNAIKPGETLLSKSVVSSCGLTECLEKVAEASGWKEKRGSSTGVPPVWVRKVGSSTGVPPVQKVLEAQHRPESCATGVRGIGLAVGSCISGFPLGMRFSSSAFVKFNEDGTASVITGVVDNGQGNESMMVQVAAEELGIPMQEISLVNGDTELAPQDPGTYSMTATFVSANAVKNAAQDAGKQILTIASGMMESPPELLELKDRHVRLRTDPRKKVTIQDVIKQSFIRGNPILGKGSYMPKPISPKGWADWAANKMEGQHGTTYTFGAAIAEVEVDRETGEVRVLKLTIADDMGFPINPTAVEGQMQGYAMMLLGQGLVERCDWEPLTGRLLSNSLLSYHLPTSLETPQMQCYMIYSIDPEGPYGGKDAGIGGTGGVIGAIANAIYNATGKMPKKLPISPDMLLNIIKNSK